MMENDEEGYEVIPEYAPQASYLKSVGFSCLDFASTPSTCGPSELQFLKKNKDSFKTFVRRIFGRFYICLKKIIKPGAVYSREVELIKHSGLLFKENAVLVEEFSLPLSNVNERNLTYLKPLICFNLSVVLPLAFVVLKAKKSISFPTIVLFSFTSAYVLVQINEFYSRFSRCSCLESFVLSLKLYNQKFLKSLQFISENDRKMMENYSRINKLEISSFNSFRVLDPSWLHFKQVVAESAVQLLQNIHALCRVLNELPTLQKHLNYQSICSVDFIELGVNEVDTDSHQVYLSLLSKLKLLLFLLESELLSFIAINLSGNHLNSRVGCIFLAINDISKILARSSNNIEYYYNRFYTSGEQELLLEKNSTFDVVDSDLAKIFLETRALSHSTLSVAIQVRNLEKTLENEIQAPKLINKAQILKHLDEAICNIEFELLSSQHKLKSLARLSMLNQEPSNDSDYTAAKLVLDHNLEGIERPGIEVGRSDFNPTQPDEVFVGISTVLDERTDFESDDGVSEEHLYALAFNKSSKKLIKELKVRLKDKKIEMVKREKIALEQKNITDLAEIDNLSFESSDDEENSNSLKIETVEKVPFFRRPSSLDGEDCVIEQSKNANPSEVNAKKMVSFKNRNPLNDSSCRDESLQARANNAETDDSRRVSNIPCDTSFGAEQNLFNPLAMSITNISRVWNQELNRTEECFGSDSDSSSDHEI